MPVTAVTLGVPSPTGAVLEHAELIAKVRRGEDGLVPKSLLDEANDRIAELESQLEHRGAAEDELKALAREFDLAYDGLYASHQLRRLSPAISPDLREKILAAPTLPIEKRPRDDAFEEPADDCPSTPPAPLSPRTLSFGNGEASTSSAKKVKTAAEFSPIKVARNPKEPRATGGKKEWDGFHRMLAFWVYVDVVSLYKGAAQFNELAWLWVMGDVALRDKAPTPSGLAKWMGAVRQLLYNRTICELQQESEEHRTLRQPLHFWP
jgi:hypothetical protein